MRTIGWCLVVFSLFFTTPASAGGPPVVLWLKLGENDVAPGLWTGSVTVENGRLAGMQGWRFEHGDRVQGNRFVCLTRRRGPRSAGPVLENGLIIAIEGNESTGVTVATNRGELSVVLRDLKPGASVSTSDGQIRLYRTVATWQLPVRSVAPEPEDPPLLPGAHVVPPLMGPEHDGNSQEDWPSIAVTDDGRVWVAWTSYFAGRVEVRVASFDGARWSDPEVIAPGGDILTVALAASGRTLWCVWSRQVEGNFDLYGRVRREGKWSEPFRLTTDPGPDIFPVAVGVSMDRAVVAWMGVKDGKSRVFATFLDADGKSGGIIPVGESAVNEWFPAVAADGRGGAWIGYDAYTTASYDVHVARIGPEGVVERITVAATPRFEANCALARAPDGALLVAWEESGPNWGKDHGRFGPQRGTTGLYPSRTIRLALYRGGHWYEPAADLLDSLPSDWRSHLGHPQVVFDATGKLWVFFQKRHLKYHYPWQRGVWETYCTVSDGQRWTPASLVPNTNSGPAGRVVPVLFGNSLWLTWSTDQRPWRRPVILQHRVHVARVSVGASSSGAPPVWREREERPVSVPVVVHPTEQADIERMRKARWQMGGRTLAVYRGDLHRHTDWSWDAPSDGSIFDMYRYALDAADLDFIAGTEHVGWGTADRGNQAYAWWRNEQLCDAFYRPGYFVPLYAYERSMHYPFGHRNVINPRRGIPPVMGFLDRWGRIRSDDTRLLYEALKKTGSIAMAHTTATVMGTDWADNDPLVEPLVEIYQGCRLSYEMRGAPRAAQRPHAYEPGYVINALNKGYRLGFQSSSDHTSTHMSYTCVYAADFSRAGLIAAMKERLSYGATDNILVRFYATRGDTVVPLGSETDADRPVTFHIEVSGTANIRRVSVVRNGEVVYAAEPNEPVVTLAFADMKPPARSVSYYYVRVEQEDGQLAWASPIWIRHSEQETESP